MAKSYDSIVVGGGHNGLICAAYLAKAGRSVLVLERRHVLGGAAVSEEVFPGFTYSVCSYVVSLLRPWIIRDLDLPRFGLEMIPLEASFLPLPDGRSLLRGADAEETRREIAAFSPRDAEHYPQFGRAMTKIGQFVKPIIDDIAPEPTSWNPRELAGLLRLGRRFQQGSVDEMELRLKLLTMSAVDLLDGWFESEVLKSPMSVSGIIGTFLGVRSPGTAYVLLHHYMGEIDGAFRSWGFAKGGTGSVSLAAAGAAQHHGAEIRTEAAVERVLIEGGQARGVVLADGEEIRAKSVVSGCDPRLTFLGFVGEEHLPDEFVAGLRRYRYRGSSGKVNMALDRLPSFSCRPGDGPHLRGDVAIAPSFDYLERAYDDAKYGRFSARPYINVVIPSTCDPSIAPPGKHVMSCFVQYAPYDIEGGPARWPEEREAFGDAVVDTLTEYIPDLRETILHRQVLTPWDLEQEYGLTEGNIFHGELSLEQLAFQRPVAGWARYRTPVRGLWLAGSGAHPGGGIMGSPGAFCARTMLSAGALLMVSARADVVVLGGDLEGLAAAARLARAGRRVLLLEAGDELGGAARRVPFADGFAAPGLLRDVYGARRAALADLALETHGLRWSEPERGTWLCGGASEDAGLVLASDPARCHGLPDAERETLVAWRAFLERMQPVVADVLDQPPPEVAAPGAGELFQLARTGLKIRRLGEREMLELMRVAPMPVRDWLEERFTSPLLQTGLAARALEGISRGPRAAGTSALLLLRECAAGPGPAGGPPALVEALVAACRAAQVEIVLGRSARRLRPGRDGLEAVELADGEAIETPRVLSTLGPRTTLLELLPPRWCPPELEAMASAWRSEGSSAVLLVALERAPSLGGHPASEVDRAITASSLDELERAADALKYGALPEHPWLELHVPSHADPTLAPEGRAVAVVRAHGVPYDLRDGWSEETRGTLEARLLEAFGRAFPEVRESIVGHELFTPVDLEQRFGLPGGHLAQGELTLDQLWLQRPALALSRYRTPLPGLWLGGGSNHPGGPFPGGAGSLAADLLARAR